MLIFIVMVISVILKIKKTLFKVLFIMAAGACLCFAAQEDWVGWSNKCLNTSYDASADTKLKKFELNITEDAFLRLRKTYTSGKQEYFSLQLQQLADLNYLGNVYKGSLRLRTRDDDVIVQTYNDRKGNIDTMATELTIPLKNMEPERLDSLQQAFNYFKGKAL